MNTNLTYRKTVTTKNGKQERTYQILEDLGDKFRIKCLETGKTSEYLKENFLNGATEVTEPVAPVTPEETSAPSQEPKPESTPSEPKPKYDKVAKAALVTDYARNRGLTVKAKGIDPATLFIKRDKVSMTACVNRTGITVYLRGSLAKQVLDLCDSYKQQDKGRTDYTIHVPDKYLDAFFATYYTNAADWKKEDDLK